MDRHGGMLYIQQVYVQWDLTVLSLHVCRKYQKRAELQLATRGQKLLFIVVDLSPVTDIDASAVHFLMVTARTTH